MPLSQAKTETSIIRSKESTEKTPAIKIASEHAMPPIAIMVRPGWRSMLRRTMREGWESSLCSPRRSARLVL